MRSNVLCTLRKTVFIYHRKKSTENKTTAHLLLEMFFMLNGWRRTKLRVPFIWQLFTCRTFSPYGWETFWKISKKMKLILGDFISMSGKGIERSAKKKKTLFCAIFYKHDRKILERISKKWSCWGWLENSRYRPFSKSWWKKLRAAKRRWHCWFKIFSSKSRS